MVMFSKVREEYGGFEEIHKHVHADYIEKFSDKVYKSFCEKFSEGDYLTCVGWIFRHYISAKKIALGALFLTQARELQNLKMKNLGYYACYYALFNVLSANLLMHPDFFIKRAKNISHSGVFKGIENYFINCRIYNKDILDLLNKLRLTREMYSYSLPLEGPKSAPGEVLNIDVLYERLAKILPIIIQISNLMSLLSYMAWEKKVGKTVDEYDNNNIVLDENFFSVISYTDHLNTVTETSDADYYGLGYMLNTIARPFPIGWFLEDKLIDDLESGWTIEDSGESSSVGYDISAVSRYLAKYL